MFWEDFFCIFDSWKSENGKFKGNCSHDTVKRVWLSTWQKSVRFRAASEHTVCNECTNFKLWRARLNPNSKEGKALSSQYVLHIREQLDDRRVSARIECMAAQNIKASSPPADVHGDILNMTIDAMEQAKFKLPRHHGLKGKDNSMYWRPQLHVTGVVVDGVQEFWVLSSCTLSKNANTQLTTVMDVLDGVAGVLAKRGRPMPRILRIEHDNAPAEMKNQVVMKVMSYLVWKGLFCCTELAQPRPGHSHNRQDQRFAVGATAMARGADSKKVIQDVDDVRKIICDKVNPMPGMLGGRHEVKILEGAWDWTSWVDALPLQVSGHSNTAAKKASGEDPVHVYRFVLREEVETYLFKETEHDLDSIETSWPELEPDPRDVVLLTKHYKSSLELSQPPAVFCPAAWMEALDAAIELQPAALAPLNARQASELGKSADFFEKPPLSMSRASAYLRTLIACDGSPTLKGMPPLLFFHGRLDGKAKIVYRMTPPQPVPSEDVVMMPDALEFESDEDDANITVEQINQLASKKPARVRLRTKTNPNRQFKTAAEPPMLSAGAPSSLSDPLAPTRTFAETVQKTIMKKPARTSVRRAMRVRRDQLPPLQPGERLGCPKCRNNRNIGCRQCRIRLGFIEMPDGSWARREP